MSSGELARWAALGIGSFQILANAALLARGLTRLPGELVKEGATERLGTLLRAAWVYGMLGNLCLSLVLVMIAPAVRAADPLARRLATLVALYYVVVGVATYVFVPARPAGFLVFAVLGLLLLGAVRLSG